MKIIIALMCVMPLKALAMVYPDPHYYNFGPVHAHHEESTQVHFINDSDEPVSFFHVSCKDVTHEFSCHNTCFFLGPNESCPVTVTFKPHAGDNAYHSVTVIGVGVGAHSTITVDGFDYEILY